MRHIITGILLMMIFLSSCNKGETIELWVLVDGDFVLTEVDKDAEYIEKDGLSYTLSGVLKYPAAARENGIEGEVIIQYEITHLGTVRNREIIQDIGAGCGQAVIQAIESVTEGVCFIPAEVDALPVTIRKQLPVIFKLEG